MSVSLKHSYVEILSPKDDSGDGAFGHEGGVFMNEINVLIERGSKEILGPFHHV